jgi:hypothetical protein
MYCVLRIFSPEILLNTNYTEDTGEGRDKCKVAVTELET